MAIIENNRSFKTMSINIGIVLQIRQ